MSVFKPQFGHHHLHHECNQTCCEKGETVPPLPMSTTADSEHLDELSVYTSDSESSSHDSSSWSNSSSYISDDDATLSGDKGENAADDDKKETKDIAHGIFLSLKMVQLLRSRTSEGNLLTKGQIFENMVPTETKPALRRNSDGDVATGIVYAIQTKSPMEPYLAHKSDTPSPKNVLSNILLSHGRPIAPTPSSSVTTWVKSCTLGYSMELMTAVRQDDLPTIQKFHAAGHNLQCANKFQESILNAVVRRPRTDILRFLVEEAGVSMRVCCDGGRTILHDAAWTGNPCWASLRFILQKHPEFLLIADKRGFTPLDYVPKEAWVDWEIFLNINEELVLARDR